MYMERLMPVLPVLPRGEKKKTTSRGGKLMHAFRKFYLRSTQLEHLFWRQTTLEMNLPLAPRRQGRWQHGQSGRERRRRPKRRKGRQQRASSCGERILRSQRVEYDVKMVQPRTFSLLAPEMRCAAQICCADLFNLGRATRSTQQNRSSQSIYLVE